ncbi:MAG TPA: hypothetical protein VIU40_00505 [Geobacteraceae bacterium]
MRRSWLGITVLLLSCLLLAACGGGGSAATTTQSTARVVFGLASTALPAPVNIVKVRIQLPAGVSVTADAANQVTSPTLVGLNNVSVPFGTYSAAVRTVTFIGSNVSDRIHFREFAALNCAIAPGMPPLSAGNFQNFTISAQGFTNGNTLNLNVAPTLNVTFGQ